MENLLLLLNVLLIFGVDGTVLLTTSRAPLTVISSPLYHDGRWAAVNALGSLDPATLTTDCQWNGNVNQVAIRAGTNLFWQVDLGSEHDVDLVRLRAFNIDGYADNMTFKVCKDEAARSCTDCEESISGFRDTWVERKCFLRGRYVRISQADSYGKNWHFCRVAVYGKEVGPTLLTAALPSNAVTSSVKLGGSWEWSATHGINNPHPGVLETDCVWPAPGSVALQAGTNLFWQVDLGVVREVTEIRLRAIDQVGRSDDVQFSVCHDANGAYCTACGGLVSAFTNNWVSKECFVRGRYVRLSNADSNGVSWNFCRVAVYGKQIGLSLLTDDSLMVTSSPEWNNLLAANALRSLDSGVMSTECRWGNQFNVAINAGTNLFWQVELDAVYDVGRIRLRGIEYGGFSEDVQFSVCQDPHARNCQNCGGSFTAVGNDWVEVNCDVRGRYVRLSEPDSDGLSWLFCRVAVYGFLNEEIEDHSEWVGCPNHQPLQGKQYAFCETVTNNPSITDCREIARTTSGVVGFEHYKLFGWYGRCTIYFDSNVNTEPSSYNWYNWWCDWRRPTGVQPYFDGSCSYPSSLAGMYSEYKYSPCTWNSNRRSLTNRARGRLLGMQLNTPIPSSLPSRPDDGKVPCGLTWGSVQAYQFKETIKHPVVITAANGDRKWIFEMQVSGIPGYTMFGIKKCGKIFAFPRHSNISIADACDKTAHWRKASTHDSFTHWPALNIKRCKKGIFSPKKDKTCPEGYVLRAGSVNAGSNSCPNSLDTVNPNNCILTQEAADAYCAVNDCLVISQTDHAAWNAALNCYGDSVQISTVSSETDSDPNWSSCVKKRGCVDDNPNNYVDKDGQSCDWYVPNEGCGYRDTQTFNAGSMCCACGGGRQVECAGGLSIPNIENTQCQQTIPPNLLLSTNSPVGNLVRGYIGYHNTASLTDTHGTSNFINGVLATHTSFGVDACIGNVDKTFFEDHKDQTTSTPKLGDMACSNLRVVKEGNKEFILAGKYEDVAAAKTYAICSALSICEHGFSFSLAVNKDMIDQALTVFTEFPIMIALKEVISQTSELEVALGFSSTPSFEEKVQYYDGHEKCYEFQGHLYTSVTADFDVMDLAKWLMPKTFGDQGTQRSKLDKFDRLFDLDLSVEAKSMIHFPDFSRLLDCMFNRNPTTACAPATSKTSTTGRSTNALLTYIFQEAAQLGLDTSMLLQLEGQIDLKLHLFMDFDVTFTLTGESQLLLQNGGLYLTGKTKFGFKWMCTKFKETTRWLGNNIDCNDDNQVFDSDFHLWINSKETGFHFEKNNFKLQCVWNFQNDWFHCNHSMNFVINWMLCKLYGMVGQLKCIESDETPRTSGNSLMINDLPIIVHL